MFYLLQMLNSLDYKITLFLDVFRYIYIFYIYQGIYILYRIIELFNNQTVFSEKKYNYSLIIHF